MSHSPAACLPVDGWARLITGNVSGENKGVLETAAKFFEEPHMTKKRKKARKPEDLLLWQQDPKAAKYMGRAIDPNPPKRLRLFQYDLQPHIPTPWYFRAAEAIKKAWAALGKVIANGDFHHRS